MPTQSYLKTRKAPWHPERAAIPASRRLVGTRVATPSSSRQRRRLPPASRSPLAAGETMLASPASPPANTPFPAWVSPPLAALAVLLPSA